MIPKDLEQLLDGSGLPWRVENGTRHMKVIVGNRLAGIIPKGLARGGGNYRSHKNMLAQVRRAIRERQS